MPNRHIMELRKTALALPEAEEGTSCNKICFKAAKKNFLFIGEQPDGSWDVMLKAGAAQADLEALCDAEPQRYSLGASGWFTATFAEGEAPLPGHLEPLVEASYRALVPKRLVAQMG